MSCALNDLAWLVLHPLKLDKLQIFDVHSGRRRLEYGEQLIHGGVSVMEMGQNVKDVRLLHVDLAVDGNDSRPVSRGWLAANVATRALQADQRSRRGSAESVLAPKQPH